MIKRERHHCISNVTSKTRVTLVKAKRWRPEARAKISGRDRKREKERVSRSDYMSPPRGTWMICGASRRSDRPAEIFRNQGAWREDIRPEDERAQEKEDMMSCSAEQDEDDGVAAEEPSE